ncbi:trans-aconitate 2-methyltransferase [Mesorhizobium sp.]|uniref:class I SAM-dependent methyltransferase n=1 Tax=Mesorhizobium sp. TaxID=1871066 RepID=UPI000FE48548|nr:class I SAM-dependent methyltransferase [Mesorhizobium sp.]RWE56384.1 MAG: class I SAM-dependent methyltransferase [Mesorhizobium sp.]
MTKDGGFYERFPYPLNHTHHDDAQTTLLRILRSTDIGSRPKAVLDAGCGTGAFSRVLRAAFPNATIYSVDRSYASLSRLSQRDDLTDIVPVLHDFESGPLERTIADVVIFCHGVLHHCEQPKVALANILRSCRKIEFAWIWLYSQSGRYEIEMIRKVATELGRTETKKEEYGFELIREIRSFFPSSVAADYQLCRNYTTENNALDAEMEDRLMIADRYMNPVAKHYSVGAAFKLLSQCGLRVVDAPTLSGSVVASEFLERRGVRPKGMKYLSLLEKLVRPSGIGYIAVDSTRSTID